MNTETQDASHRDGWSVSARGREARQRAPRLRLLFHPNLDRIGTVSMPGAVALRWLTVGRHDPPFGGLDGSTHPLGDPQVSREQLKIRWLPDRERFEVAPVEGARRLLSLVDLAPGGGITPITAPTLVAPGSCVAIGDRVLLGLDLARVSPSDADRLGLVGESEEMWALRDEIGQVAQFGRAALVTGPTGAGKELVARALHAAGPRAAGPFIPVNCAALPETLVEAVLFGHRKGAFTGADAEAKGHFRAADGGTIFLDEVGELPLAVQPKLLRVLQDGVVVPVGAHEGRRVDVRAVAATHRDLAAEVRAGRLREDLYHRMGGHVLRVPALAERRFDVPELFVHALRLLRAEHPSLGWMWEAGRAFRPAVPIGFVAELMRAPWTGNVRELYNLVERAARLNLHPGSFHAPAPPSLERREPAAGATAEPSGEAPASERLLRVAGDTLGMAHKTVLKLLPAAALAALGPEVDGPTLRARAADALIALLSSHDFNQSSVAATLGVSRTTLIKLMDDLALPRAADLGAEEIAAARARAGGDVEAAARHLRVSPTALKKRITLLALKGRG